MERTMTQEPEYIPVKIEYEGGSGYTAKVTDLRTGEMIQNVTRAVITIDADATHPVAHLTVYPAAFNLQMMAVIDEVVADPTEGAEANGSEGPE
jgi:hypothetical protein